MSDPKTQSTKILLPKSRLSFPRIDKPYAFKKGDEPKYMSDFLIPKETNIDFIREAMVAAMIRKFGPREQWPKNYKSALKDGDRKDPPLPEYEGMWFVTATNRKYPPRLLDRARNPLAASAFYGGCWVIPCVSVYGYDQSGNRGVAFGLEGIQFIAEGDRFGGGGDCTDLFENYEDGSEDANNYGTPEKSEKADDTNPF